MNEVARRYCKRGFDRIGEQTSDDGTYIDWHIQCHGDLQDAAQSSEVHCGGAVPHIAPG
jgi:hypothetical protein